MSLSFSLRLALASWVLEVDAEVPPGITALVGPSGSGKTSLLEALAGLRPAARGRVTLGEAMLQPTSGRGLPPERRRLGYVPQDACLFPHLTVAENVVFGARGRGWREWAEQLELSALMHRRPRTLSGGERQRVALARALASSPRALLLDEPLASVDTAQTRRLLPRLRDLVLGLGIPTLYATHRAEEAGALTDRVLRLESGRQVGGSCREDGVGDRVNLSRSL